MDKVSEILEAYTRGYNRGNEAPPTREVRQYQPVHANPKPGAWYSEAELGMRRHTELSQMVQPVTLTSSGTGGYCTHPISSP